MTVNNFFGNGDNNRGNADVTEPSGESSLSARRILIVDDNRDAADMLSLLLECEGYDPSVVYHPREALEVAARLKPEFILTDIGLPEIDGYELVRMLTVMDGLSETVFIAVSGYGLPQDKVRSREAGFHHHLVKPVQHEDVLALLQTRPTCRET